MGENSLRFLCDELEKDLGENYPINLPIKEEPLDSDEEHGFSDFEQDFVLNNNIQTVDESQGKRNYNNAQEPQPRMLVRNPSCRDPRLRNQNNASSYNGPSFSSEKRKAFLEGSVKSTDLINSMPPQSSESMPMPIREIKKQCTEAQKLINSKPNILYSNIPSHPLAAGGTERQKSPLVSNNNGGIFISQATINNVCDAMTGIRYRNIPLRLQNIGNRVGADLDAISRTISSTVEETPTEVFYQDSKRSMYVQTNEVEMADATVQTTKNNGAFAFSITLDDLSKLTPEQRKGLETFKKLMNIQNDSSLSAIKERLSHRRSARALEEESRARRNFNDDEAEQLPFANPPPPSPSASKSKYSNVLLR